MHEEFFLFGEIYFSNYSRVRFVLTPWSWIHLMSMDDLLAISMDPRVGMVQGDQPLGKKKDTPTIWGNWNCPNQIFLDDKGSSFFCHFL